MDPNFDLMRLVLTRSLLGRPETARNQMPESEPPDRRRRRSVVKAARVRLAGALVAVSGWIAPAPEPGESLPSIGEAQVAAGTRNA